MTKVKAQGASHRDDQSDNICPSPFSFRKCPGAFICFNSETLKWHKKCKLIVHLAAWKQRDKVPDKLFLTPARRKSKQQMSVQQRGGLTALRVIQQCVCKWEVLCATPYLCSISSLIGVQFPVLSQWSGQGPWAVGKGCVWPWSCSSFLISSSCMKWFVSATHWPFSLCFVCCLCKFHALVTKMMWCRYFACTVVACTSSRAEKSFLFVANC